MTIGERKQFEADRIREAWRKLWPRTRWLRDAITTFEQWCFGMHGENPAKYDDDEWDPKRHFLSEETHGFRVLFETARLSERQYIKVVNWGTAIGFPMFAPLLTDDWAHGASFSAAWAMGEDGKRRRAYFWEHGEAVACPPLLTGLIKGDAAKFMVEVMTAQAKMGLVAMGVPIEALEQDRA